MSDRRIIAKIKKIVLEHAKNELVSLYIIGSFVSKDMTKTSDIDLVGIVKSSFDFRKEKLINKILNEKIVSRHKIDIGTIGYDEFFGGKQRGSITEHIELSAFMNFLKRARLIYGKRLNFNRFPIKPMSLKDELRYHIETFDAFKAGFRKKNSVRRDFSFKDFIKILFYITDLELQLARKMAPKRSYSGIAKAFTHERKHVIHYSLKLRQRGRIAKRDRQLWINEAERYVNGMKVFLK